MTSSLLALGVPMAREGWQVEGHKVYYLDMWKPAYSDAALNYVDAGTTYQSPVYPDAKKL